MSKGNRTNDGPVADVLQTPVESNQPPAPAGFVAQVHFDAFAARAATMIGEACARITHLEILLRARQGNVVQSRDQLHFGGHFTSQGYASVVNAIRAALLEQFDG